MKAEQQAEIARAEAKTAALAEESKPDDKKAEGDSLISKISIEDIMAQKEAEKKAVKPEVKAEEPAPAVEKKPEELSVEDIPAIEPEQAVKAEEPVAVEPVPAPAVEEKPEAPAPAPAADDANKPLWERAGGEEISEEEIFGDDTF